MELNPMKKLAEFKAKLPSPRELKELGKIGRNTSKQVEKQVEEIVKQTNYMAQWAKYSELQVIQMERIVKVLERIADKK